MKIVCSQIDLSNNLSIISRAVPSRPSHPILANVLLLADEEKNQITLTGFDLSLGIRSTFSAEVEKGGKITLPAKLFNDIVARLPDGQIVLEYEQSDSENNPLINLNSLSGKFQLRGVIAEEYPDLPIVDREEAFLLSIPALSEGLKGSLFAASSDETKQILTGIHLQRVSDTLEFAATDGHRLAVVKTSETREDQEEEEIEAPNPEQNFTITIPARALRELEKIMAIGKDEPVIALYVDETQVVFELGCHHLTSRKLDGAYPNYNQLIPPNFERSMSIDRKQLIESLERVSVLSDQKNNLVKFHLHSQDQKVLLSVEAKELGNAEESVPAEITGDAFEIGFNIRYLMEGLKSLSANNIKFNFNSPIQPVIINPLSGVQMTYLIMPVQIRD